MHWTIPGVGGCASVGRHIAGFAIVLAVSGFGCAGGGAGNPFVSQRDARIHIEVINHGFQDATLHAVSITKRIPARGPSAGPGRPTTWSRGPKAT